MPQNIFFISLGCAKNRVDAERMIGLAQQLGYRCASRADLADVLVVNTCGFIQSATEESIETILDLISYKEKGRCKKLIVTGCLAQRHPNELAEELPEVDHFLGTADWPKLQAILKNSNHHDRLQVSNPGNLAEEEFARALVGSKHSSYLKIAEGCDRQCAFCIIPTLRGRQRSISVDLLVAEASKLVKAGAKELVLVAQDTTAYGHDLSVKPQLADLLTALDKLDGLHWIRVLYGYPTAIDQKLLKTMAKLDKVTPYLDLPLQHIDSEVLRRMHRGYDEAKARSAMEMIREHLPDAYLRTTLISGHPGETEEAHKRLLAFVREMEFDHLGVFAFSPEEGTEAANQPDQVPAKIARSRAAEIMKAQRTLSRKKLKKMRGKIIEVLVEGESEESEYLLEGRHAGQAPEIDGVVIITDAEKVAVGDLIKVRVTDASDYDLIATADVTEVE